MIEIIPAINAKTFLAARKKILAVEPYAPWVQIDVSDGVFTSYKNWNNPEEWNNFSPSVLIELHMMVANPIKALASWLKYVKPQRVIAHIESFIGKNKKVSARSVYKFIETLRKNHVAVGLSFNPDSSPDALRPWLGQIDVVQVLAVDPGPSGQGFHHMTIAKIKVLEKWAPFRIIEVDGGITPEIAHRCVEAGADAVVSGDFIFKEGSPIGEASEPGKQIEKLRAATYGVWRP